jgi:hypothetical protein
MKASDNAACDMPIDKGMKKANTSSDEIDIRSSGVRSIQTGLPNNPFTALNALMGRDITWSGAQLQPSAGPL